MKNPGADVSVRTKQKLLRELEKKFSGKHVCIIAQRRILPREGRQNRTQKQKRPFSRTLTSVHEVFACPDQVIVLLS